MIRIIGDIHGKVKNVYLDLIKDVEYSIQLGDFGFKEAWETLKNVHSEFHKILPGNHDDYDYIKKTKPQNVLEDFGEYQLGGMKFFFVRGGYSIDKKWRIPGISWWEDEELSYKELQDASDVYDKIKPDIVITHTFPDTLFLKIFINKWQVIPTITGQGLSNMYNLHKPKLWVFGHMHPETNFIKKIENTTFICLKEFGYIDYNPLLPIEENIQNLS